MLQMTKLFEGQLPDLMMIELGHMVDHRGGGELFVNCCNWVIA